MQESDHPYMPPMVALEFAFAGEAVCSVPAFLLFQLLPERDRSSEQTKQYELSIDLIAKGDDCIYSTEEFMRFAEQYISWGDLRPNLSCPTFLLESCQSLWESKDMSDGPLEIRLALVPYPEVIYRYFRFRENWAEDLLKEGKLFMPCPAKFNDPFDCGLEEAHRLKFLEGAIACFSTVKDDVLMFSHYADNHRGFVVGFDTRTLLKSMDEQNPDWHPSIRPVQYLPKAPHLDLNTEVALCATCKSDVWKYENEFRLFMTLGENTLAPSGAFSFDRNAIREVIIGCKASDETIVSCKKNTNDLSGCKRTKAYQKPNSFSLSFHEIL